MLRQDFGNGWTCWLLCLVSSYWFSCEVKWLGWNIFGCSVAVCFVYLMYIIVSVYYLRIIMWLILLHFIEQFRITSNLSIDNINPWSSKALFPFSISLPFAGFSIHGGKQRMQPIAACCVPQSTTASMDWFSTYLMKLQVPYLELLKLNASVASSFLFCLLH